MAGQKHFLRTPYGAYHNPPAPEEDTELTHVERGSACGEYLRRFWQPIAIASEVGELPLKVRMFGEDLVLFRSRGGQWGLLDLHCSHRGTSLEYGVVEPRGLRCCYHSWLFAPDGRILETPGEPPASTLKDRLYHGAYPVEEHDGLVFAYMGPPEKRPEFAPYDSFAMADGRLVPYYITYPCNWLQVQENVMDPAHAVFLHTRISFSQFADAWGELPVTEFRETPTGMIYITTRRWGDNVWVRSNDIVFGNIAQVGHIWEDGQETKLYMRTGITRWTTPVDNRTCRIIGWRHFHPDGDPGNNADEGQCGPETVDFFGQNGARGYEDRQRIPGDFDAQTSQRPIAVHALEHMTATDKGVLMLRKLLRSEIRRVAADGDPKASEVRAGGRIPTCCHDTVVRIPPAANGGDDALLQRVGEKITEINLDGAHRGAADRDARIRRLIAAYAESENGRGH